MAYYFHGVDSAVLGRNRDWSFPLKDAGYTAQKHWKNIDLNISSQGHMTCITTSEGTSRRRASTATWCSWDLEAEIK